MRSYRNVADGLDAFDAGLLTVGRSQAAWDADATFILNQKNGLYTGHPEVRTSGLPDHVRRLGDLRWRAG